MSLLIGRDVFPDRPGFFGSIRRAFVVHRYAAHAATSDSWKASRSPEKSLRTRVLMIGTTATSLRLPGGTAFPRLEEIPIVDRSSFARASARRIARMRRSQECAVDAESSFAAMTKAIAQALLCSMRWRSRFQKTRIATNSMRPTSNRTDIIPIWPPR